MRKLILILCYVLMFVSVIYGETSPQTKDRFNNSISPVYNFYSAIYPLIGLLLVAASGFALKKSQFSTFVFYIGMAVLIFSSPQIISVLLDDLVGLGN